MAKSQPCFRYIISPIVLQTSAVFLKTLLLMSCIELSCNVVQWSWYYPHAKSVFINVQYRREGRRDSLHNVQQFVQRSSLLSDTRELVPDHRSYAFLISLLLSLSLSLNINCTSFFVCRWSVRKLIDGGWEFSGFLMGRRNRSTQGSVLFSAVLLRGCCGLIIYNTAEEAAQMPKQFCQ